MSNVVLLALAVGFFFAAWPLVMKASQLGPAWIIITLCIGSITVGFATVISNLVIPPSKNLLIGYLAGITSGLGVFVYGKLISDKAIELSQAIPLSMACIVVFAALGGCLFYAEPFTITKIVGVLMVVVAVFLLA